MDNDIHGNDVHGSGIHSTPGVDVRRTHITMDLRLVVVVITAVAVVAGGWVTRDLSLSWKLDLTIELYKVAAVRKNPSPCAGLEALELLSRRAMLQSQKDTDAIKAMWEKVIIDLQACQYREATGGEG